MVVSLAVGFSLSHPIIRIAYFALSLFFFSSLRLTTFTMNASDPVDLAEIAKSKAASHDIGIDEKNPTTDEITIESAPQQGTYAVDGIDKTLPTNDELANLRRIAGKIPWAAYTIAFVELCERFSYYGTTAVCKIASPSCTESKLTTSVVNFIQRPLPEGSITGALVAGTSDWSNGSPGALAMGQQASTGLTLCK